MAVDPALGSKAANQTPRNSALMLPLPPLPQVTSSHWSRASHLPLTSSQRSFLSQGRHLRRTWFSQRTLHLSSSFVLCLEHKYRRGERLFLRTFFFPFFPYSVEWRLRQWSRRTLGAKLCPSWMVRHRQQSPSEHSSIKRNRPHLILRSHGDRISTLAIGSIASRLEPHLTLP